MELNISYDIEVKYRKAFTRMDDEHSQFEAYFTEKVGGKKIAGPLGFAYWEKAGRLVKFLKIFYDATLKFSGTSIMTANQPLLWMCTILIELEKCIKGDDMLMADIAIAMKLKFDKYWGRLEDMNKIMLVAVVLDPKYKLLYTEYFFPKIQEDQKKVKAMVNDLKSKFVNLYAEYIPEAAQASLSSTQQESDSVDATMVEEDFHAASMHEFMKLRKEKDIVEIKNEVEKYLLEASEDPSNPNFSLLDWWKEHAVRFPILSQIAMDFLAVPASTVASESVFSLGKNILDPFRLSLTPQMVETLIFSSDWLRVGSKPLFNEPTRDEMEQYTELKKMTLGDSTITHIETLDD